MDVSIQMQNDRRRRHDLRRLILIGSLLAESVRRCADGAGHGTCDDGRVELATAWHHQLNISRPHLIQAEAQQEEKR